MSKHIVELQDFPNIKLSEYAEVTIEYNEDGSVRDVFADLPTADRGKRLLVSIYEVLDLDTLPTEEEALKRGGNG